MNLYPSAEAEAEVNDHKRGRNEKIIIDQLTEFYPKYSPPFLSGLRSQDKYFVNFLQLVDVNEKEGWWKARIYFEISQKVWNNHIWGQYNESYQDWTLEVPAGMFWTPNPSKNPCQIDKPIYFYPSKCLQHKNSSIKEYDSRTRGTRISGLAQFQ